MSKFLTTWSIKVADLGSHTLENLRAQAIASERSIGELQKDLTSLRNDAREADAATAGLNKQLAKAKDQSEIDAVNLQLDDLRKKAGTARSAADVLEQAIMMKGGRKSLHQLGNEAGVLRGKLQHAMDDADAARYKKELRGIETQIKKINAELDKSEGGMTTKRGGGKLAQLKGSLMEIPGVSGAVGALTSPIGAAVAGFTALAAGIGHVVSEANAFQKVRQQVAALTNTTGQAADAIAAKAGAIGDVFEADTQEVARAANTLVKQMGISFESAFSLIQKGFQAGGGEDLLNQIDEYAPHFRDAGASAEQFIATIAASRKSGIYSDKGPDAIKEMGLRLREMTPAAEQALVGAFGPRYVADLKKRINNGTTQAFAATQEIFGKLKTANVGVQKVQTLVADVMGGPGEDATVLGLMNAFELVGGGIDKLVDSSSKFVIQQNAEVAAKNDLHKAQLKLAETTGPLAQKWEVFSAQLMTSAIPAIEALLDALMNLAGADLSSRLMDTAKRFSAAESEFEKDQALLAADEETQARFAQDPQMKRRIELAKKRSATAGANADAYMLNLFGAAGIDLVARRKREAGIGGGAHNNPLTGTGHGMAGGPQSMNQVQTAQASAKNINVTILKLVETVEINTATLPQASTQIRAEVARIMTDSVRDWEETY